MDNDNKVTVEEKSVKIHQEVMLFLGEELNSIHKDTESQAYNIENEYEKTKKNKSPFVLIILVSCLIVVTGIAFFTKKVVSAKNEEISVSLQEFDDLNLKSLLDTVSAAQTNYDNAVKNKVQLEADLESQLRAAKESRDNDIFVVDSMNLKYKTVYNDKISLINKQYDAKVKLIHDEYDDLILQADKEVETYKEQLAEFDSAKVASAREQEKALDSERRLRELETKKLTQKYEARIADLEKSITDIQIRNTENMRKSVAEVSAQYQKEIDALDPTLRDATAIDIIDEAVDIGGTDFDGLDILLQQAIVSEKVSSFVESYQDLYNNFKYLDDVVASIPQKNSIPHYVSSARIMVNNMGETFMDATISYYNETEQLKDNIDDLNNQITTMKRDFEAERREKEAARVAEKEAQKSMYESTLITMLDAAKSNALVLSATDYESIKVYIKPAAQFLVGDEGADAEIKVAKGIKGKLWRNEDDSFRFEVAPDKEGNIPEIDFSLLVPGSLIKILSK